MEFLQQQQPQLCNINIKPRKSILEVHNHKLGGGMIGAEGSEKYPPNKIVQIQSVFRGVLERKRIIQMLNKELQTLRTELNRKTLFLGKSAGIIQQQKATNFSLKTQLENANDNLALANTRYEELQKSLDLYIANETNKQHWNEEDDPSILERDLSLITLTSELQGNCSSPAFEVPIVEPKKYHPEKQSQFQDIQPRNTFIPPAKENLKQTIWGPVNGISRPLGFSNQQQQAPQQSNNRESPPFQQMRTLWSPLDFGSTADHSFMSESSGQSDLFYKPQVDGNQGCNFMEDLSNENNIHSFVYLVEKIVKTNDQPASLLLQQKLRSSSAEVKDMIFEAIMGQGVPLMKNRFGNFLMQRCIEFGTKEQIRLIGEATIGHIQNLSCDRFACHVIQKAIEYVDHDLKSKIISELLHCIPETITHKHAAHVWQRVFETKWKEPPALLRYIDGLLKNQWAHVANDENGSLVIQCIFENSVEVEKESIVCEVLSNLVDVARGQWGNWVIQHILEHGNSADKAFIIKVVSQNIFFMSIDQYASKVVEKALKFSGKREFFEMVDVVLSPSPRQNSPRPYILDMMNNTYGNYVVQHILNIAEAPQRDHAVRIITPYISTLRNSKYGQRVASIVENKKSLASINNQF